MDNNRLLCPTCNSNKLMIKYEAKYVYSYVIDNDAPGLKNTAEFLPFMYDGREQTESKQYIECSGCGNQYPCFISHWDERINFKVLQKTLENTKV
ncbi:UNVERIFIED_CONTAM: hypothetical protein Cloal_0520 [Acetivibrio alkalicellulosi]